MMVITQIFINFSIKFQKLSLLGVWQNKYPAIAKVKLLSKYKFTKKKLIHRRYLSSILKKMSVMQFLIKRKF